MCLLWKITYGEFSEFVREKKITYNLHRFRTCILILPISPEQLKLFFPLVIIEDMADVLLLHPLKI